MSDSTFRTPSERLSADLKTLLQDVEALLKQAALATGEQAVALRAQATAKLHDAKDLAYRVQGVVVERGKQVARSTDDYVHDQPWAAAGIGALLGLAVGLLLRRAR